MIDNEKHINDIFKNAFDGSSETPPDGIWRKIEKQLDESSVETVFKNTFSNSTVEPPVGLWSKIQTKLWVRDFMQFTPHKVNIYYTSMVAVLAGVGLFLSNNKAELTQNKSQEIQINKPIVSQSNAKNKEVKTVQPVQSNNSNQKPLNSNSSKPIVISQKTNNDAKNLATVEKKTITESVAQSVKEKVNVAILGDTVICVGTEHFYEIEKSYSGEIKWNITPKTAVLEKLSKSSVSVNIQKAGVYTLEIEGNKGKLSEIKIKAVESVKPTIAGNTKVCEGTQAQFKVANAQYIGKMYAWDVSVNKYSNVTAGVIVLDCKYPGFDTIMVRDINTKTGCNNITKYPIIVFPKPNADFKIVDNGDGIIELQNTSKCGQKSINCKQTTRWSANDQTFTNKNNVQIEFAENGSYQVVLEVQNEFACKDVVKKDVVIDIQTLYVPNAFSPGVDNQFLPKGENLQQYKIEIYDSHNKKLWESAQLVDGKPSDGWNGQYQGELVPEGTYFWRISATFKDGTKWQGVKQKGKYQTFGPFILLNK